MVINFSPQAFSTKAAISQNITVNFNYQVHFTKDLFDLKNTTLVEVINPGQEAGQSKILVVVDGGLLNFQPALLEQIETYTSFYGEILNLAEKPIIVPGGEAAKNHRTCLDQIHQTIDKNGLCRHSYIIAIGGGAVLDLVGYAAATAHRGIRLIRVPTTVLGQNDSGVGVKNSVNAFGKKNFLGTFAPPYAVINDSAFLTTLTQRDWRSGIAEAVKVALIKDGDFFDFIHTNTTALNHREGEIMQQLIYRCAQLHLQHIANSGDAFESGSSRPLDFGHWAGHRMECLTNYSLRHGEAVAIGMALDSTYSYFLGKLSYWELQKIVTTLKALDFILYVPELAQYISEVDHPRCLFRGLKEFREHLGGELCLTLLEGIGESCEVDYVNLSLYQKAVWQLQKFALS